MRDDRYTKEQFLDIAVKACPKLKENLLIGHTCRAIWISNGLTKSYLARFKTRKKAQPALSIGVIPWTFILPILKPITFSTPCELIQSAVSRSHQGTPWTLPQILHTRISHRAVKHTKLFQLFIEKGVVTIIAKINNATYNRTRIAMVLRIFVYQSF